MSNIELSDYIAISDIDSWGFTDDQLEMATSYSVEEDSDTGNLYLSIYGQDDEFIAEIEFAPSEIHTMQAYIDEYLEVDYEDEIYSPDWDALAKTVGFSVNDGAPDPGIINGALDVGGSDA